MNQLSGDEFTVRFGDIKKVLVGSLIGGLLGGAINFLIYFGGLFFLGATYAMDVDAGAPVGIVSPVMVAFATVIPALIGGLILYGLDQYNSENAFRIFIGIAIAVTLLSIYQPFAFSVNVRDSLLLIAMHFVAMLSTVWGLYQFGAVRNP
jgi:hypothetical protein